MTIAIAWVATRSDSREDLYFAADSRTRGVRVLDLSQKILLLPRSDCAVCFAGDTSAAYPLMLQISAAIAAHEPARERNLDVAELKHHLLRVLTDTMATVQDAAEPFDPSDGQFILGGYSWRSKTFRIWTVYFENKTKKFRARESNSFHPRLTKVAFIGDWATRYRSTLVNALSSGVRRPAEHEPLSVLADLLRATTIRDSIGGAPQVVRIGPHMNTRPLCVLWGPEKDRHLFGRKLFDYENCDYWSIDPDTGAIYPPKHFAVGQERRPALDSAPSAG